MGPGLPLRSSRDDSGERDDSGGRDDSGERGDSWRRPEHHHGMGGGWVYFVYILASRPYGTLYTGVTNDIIARTYDHRSGEIPGFTRKYGVHRLVWFEQHTDINFAILREKRIKRWRRDWKFNLIEETNPHWEDYYPKLLEAGWFATRDSVSRG